jgi:hypothetical protein
MPLFLSAKINPVILNGAWSWFSDPRAIVVDGQIVVGAVAASSGSLVVAKPNRSAVTLKASFEVDDHNNPALLRRSSDGKIIAHYSKHSTDNNHYQRISTNADDVSTFDAETNLAAAFGGTVYTYSHLVEITDGMFCFVRCATGGDSEWSPHYSISTDGGENWSALTKLFFVAGERPYFKVIKGAANRIDVAVNDGHPNEVSGNSLYYCYYDGSDNSWHDRAGNVLTLPITPSTDLSGTSKIYDGSSTKSWIQQIQVDGSGNPVVVYSAYPSTADHRYRYARWNGTSWDDHQICTAGKSLYSAEAHYSGGICIDPDDTNIIYCSREKAGLFHLWKGVTADNGATWTMTQLTAEKPAWDFRLFKSACDFRPFKVAGTDKLVYVSGTYRSYSNFSTKIKMLTV